MLMQQDGLVPEHFVPQLPQLLTSLFKSAHMPRQQSGVTPLHLVPQAPQLLTSAFTLAHVPLQQVSDPQSFPQVPQFWEEFKSTQVPLQHASAQVVPQCPQLPVSLDKSTHVPLQHVLPAEQHVELLDVPQRLLTCALHEKQRPPPFLASVLHCFRNAEVDSELQKAVQFRVGFDSGIAPPPRCGSMLAELPAQPTPSDVSVAPNAICPTRLISSRREISLASTFANSSNWCSIGTVLSAPPPVEYSTMYYKVNGGS
jgi:hypothetical protein